VIIVGLTGSIAMGKSETARMFRARGVPVFDADAAVHAVYAPGGAAVADVLQRFPQSRSVQGGIDRAALSKQVLADPTTLTELENLVHPHIRRLQAEFLTEARRGDHRLVVIDHPLLFETGGDKAVDVIIVVSAPEEVQRARALTRPGMSAEKLAAILARQLPDAEKRTRADYIIDTSRGLPDAEAQVSRLIETLTQADH
jgi:dephospho-CoA kinase